MTGLSLTDKVMVGTAILGGMSGIVGSFAVLRGRSLVGDMLAHAALPGVCIAFLATGRRDMLPISLGALASGLAAIVAVSVVVRWTRTKEDAALGIVLSTFFGLGVVLLSRIQKSEVTGNKAGLESYLFGEPGNMLDRDLALLAIVALFVLGTMALLFKEFKVVSFDMGFAESQGWPTLRLDLLMMAALAVVTIVGLPIAGVVLMAAFIILPAATARFWTNQLHTMLCLAAGLGMVAGVLGTRLSQGLPAGASIVLAASAAFVLSLLFAPKQGIVSRAVAEIRLRRRIEREHLLRSLYELNEANLPNVVPVSLARLQAYRYWKSLSRRLQEAVESGLVTYANENIKLTPLGLHRAAKLTKTHRLWEMYLMQHAGIAPDHVDRDADDVEHLLSESLLLDLESQLAAEGRLPSVLTEIPESPHDMEDGTQDRGTKVQ